ncbi:methylmalonyl-CoA mutase family protein [Caldifermentibacillus hisashii]|uniref:Methylmalonyl-CoA mutase family protein n=1 Tax=Caldifermentibacillus hisashii TaxID=996558 RepID=A0ABU9JY63_9BACI
MKEGNGVKQLSAAIQSTFPDVTYEQWVEAADRALKGKTIGEHYRKTYENITIKPLYTKADLPVGYERMYPATTGHNSWYIAQAVTGKTIEELHTNLLSAIRNGQNSISLTIPDCLDATAFAKLFHHIDVANIPFFIEGEEEVIPFYAFLTEGIKGSTEREKITGWIGTDPVAVFCRNRYSSQMMKTFYSIWQESLHYMNRQFPNLKTIYVDGTIYEKSGGNAVQQIAFALATAVEHIEQIKKSGWNVEQIFSKIFFGFSISSHFFMEIAKLRAARYLWKKIAESYHVPNVAMDIYAETTNGNKSKLDPYTNMLRIGGEAFAATIGQVQILRVSPYDEVFGEVSALGQRISRNIHHLFREEAKLSLVSDPAGGSYFVESLTQQLIEKAWTLFLTIEDSGGMLSSIIEGKVQNQVAEMKAVKQSDVNQRKTKLIGTNQYVDLTEKLHDPFETAKNQAHSGYLAVSDFYQVIEKVKAGTRLDQFFTKVDQASEGIQPLQCFRLSEPYEKIRFEVAKYENETGEKPTAILINCGDLKDKKLIFDEVSEWLHTAGIATEISQDNDFDKIIKESGKKLYCFCGNDQELTAAFSDIQFIVQKYPDKGFIIAGSKEADIHNKFKQIGVQLILNTQEEQVQCLERIVRFFVKGE